jgi:hypothetical protein
MTFEEFTKNTNLMLAIDHGSRAGNAFFLTLFDQHPNVLCLSWMLYTYSYFIHEFDTQEIYDSKKAHEIATHRSYFRFSYNDLNVDLIDQMTRWGADPSAALDRNIVRNVFDEIVLKESTISRKNLVCAMLYAYALATNRDLSKVKYILLADAISLRYEDPISGFSGKIIDVAEIDFPDFRLCSLNRDPRAQFASCKHQYINLNKNNYGLNLKNFGLRFGELLQSKLYPENFASLYWMLYQVSTYKTIKSHLARRPKSSILIINEKLNLDFRNTMHELCRTLGVEFLK